MHYSIRSMVVTAVAAGVLSTAAVAGTVGSAAPVGAPATGVGLTAASSGPEEGRSGGGTGSQVGNGSRPSKGQQEALHDAQQAAQNAIDGLSGGHHHHHHRHHGG